MECSYIGRKVDGHSTEIMEVHVREKRMFEIHLYLQKWGSKNHFNLVAIRLMSTFHFGRLSASSLLQSYFKVSSSTCFIHVIFGHLWVGSS